MAENDLNLLPLSGAGHYTCRQVTYSSRSICAPRGSTLEIDSSYSTHAYDSNRVSPSWVRSKGGLQGRRHSLEDLSNTLQSAGRVQVTHRRRGSTLRIRNLTEDDSAEYRFRLKTGGSRWKNILPGTRVTVTGTEQDQLM